MNKTFKKIAASVMAVTSLVVSMTSFSTSAVEPRYGGSRTMTFNGKTATISIDKSSTFGYASTKSSSSGVTKLYAYAYVSFSGGYNSDGVYGYDGSASITVYAPSGKTPSSVSSTHRIYTSDTSYGQDAMTV